ncbi:MAG TPA: methionyl-tRNA formyltransferase [Bryobacteraceae bacterium]|nr:methionyl-tRNA formyltransferase [Bryobacteraceae bacterium]
MRIVFLGTPHFAVASLEKVVYAGHDVVAVYTQPDRPKGRGQQLAFSPVKEAALRASLPVLQPERIRQREAVAAFAGHRADAAVVVGYGQLIPQSVIDLPRLGIINVHASLLPKYRGAAPVQWAIARGESVTGVTTMLIDAGLDTGAMLLKAETPIGNDETAVELGRRLAVLGADLVPPTLAGLDQRTLQPVAQDDSQASWAPVLRREDGRIDWSLPAKEIWHRCRGFQPWPGVWSTFRGQRLYIWRAKPANDISLGFSGSLVTAGRRLTVICGDGTTLEIEELQPEGRKRMSAEAFLNGQRLRQDERLGEQSL